MKDQSRLEIRTLQKKDYRKAWGFAKEGMHFSWYIDNAFLLEFFSKGFFLSELLYSTQVIAVYSGDTLAGVLLARVKGEDPVRLSFGQKLFLRIFGWLSDIIAKDGLGPYERANQEMLECFQDSPSLDGEILYLAADLDLKIKGIGSLLLEELEKREAGKKMYVYSDSACSWQFYPHRGFECMGERDVFMDFSKKHLPLKCFLFVKKLR